MQDEPDQLQAALEAIERDYVEVLGRSQIHCVNPDQPGDREVFIGAGDGRLPSASRSPINSQR